MTDHEPDDENEPTRVYLKSVEETLKLIGHGEFEDAGSLAAALLVLRKLNI
jgi:hypothetical protein